MTAGNAKSGFISRVYTAGYPRSAAKDLPVRAHMECRLCGALIEGYCQKVAGKREPNLHDLSFQMANEMTLHLTTEHEVTISRAEERGKK